jgi:xanthine dehydrogenase FAD-binding subunit
MTEVFSPSHLSEALSLMERIPGIRPMSGGTDLLVRQRAMGEVDPSPLMLLSRIDELGGIGFQKGELVLGAATPFARIVSHPLVKTHAPPLATAAATIGGPALRNMATIGGNIQTASPAADSLPALYVMRARLVLVSHVGTRILPIDEFIRGPGKTDLLPNELIMEIRIPSADGSEAWHFEKVGRRKSLAIAVASFCGMLRFSGDGKVSEARFAWGSVAPTVARSVEAEQAVIGSRLDQGSVKKSILATQASLAPIDDIRATAEYRRMLAVGLLACFLDAPRSGG